MLIDNYLSALVKEKEIVKNSLFIFLSGLLSAGFSMTSTILFSRFFGPTNFGLYVTAFSLAATLAYLMDLGIIYLLPRYIAEFEKNKKPENTVHLIEKTLILKGITTFFILILFWIFGLQISQTFFHDPKQLIIIVPTMSLFVIIFLNITIPILQGFQNFKLISLTAILIPFFNVAIGLPLGFFFGVKAALAGAAVAFILGSLPAFLFILNKVSRKRSQFRDFSFKKIFVTYSLPAYFSNVPTYSFIFIVPLLSLFFSQKRIGFYSFSLSFYTAALLISVSLGNVMFPKIAQLKSQNKELHGFETLKRLFLIYTPVVIIGSLLSIFLTRPIVAFLVPSFQEASKIAIIQTIAALLIGYFVISINFVIASGRLKLAAIMNWTISIIFVIFSFYLTNLPND